MHNGGSVRVAFVATHPIQYHVPWFRCLAGVPDIDAKVFYGVIPDAGQQGVGFDVPFNWDIPLLDGYHWVQLENTARKPDLGRFSGCNTPSIYGALREWRPDVVILTGWHSLMLVQAIWACRRLRLPIIIRGESNTLRERSWHKRLGHRMLMKVFDDFLSIGKSNRAFYERAGVSPDRIHDSPYFVDNDRFTRAAKELAPKRAELRTRWSIPDDAGCYLFAGKLVPKKRPLDLLRAQAVANKAGAKVHLLMVGSGEMMAELQRFAADQDLSVSFTGFLNQTEIVDAYVAADCVVLPSDSGETWGLVVNEGMACGLPAIVSDKVGCGPDLIIENETGAVFRMGDVGGLAETLTGFANKPSVLHDMGKKAETHVRSHYSVEKAVEGTLAAIKAVASRPPK